MRRLCGHVRAAVNGLNGRCVDYSWYGGDSGLASEILKEFGVATEIFVFGPSAGATRRCVRKSGDTVGVNFRDPGSSL